MDDILDIIYTILYIIQMKHQKNTEQEILLFKINILN